MELEEKKQKVQNNGPSAAPLLTTETLPLAPQPPFPRPQLPWSSMRMLLYQCGLVRRIHTTREGIPCRELEEKKKQKGQNDGG